MGYWRIGKTNYFAVEEAVVVVVVGFITAIIVGHNIIVATADA